jgi:hypothetical protein
MNALQCRECRIVFLLAWSGCAGSLDNAEDFQTVPVRDAGPRGLEAGRAPMPSGQVAGVGGSKPVSAGAGGAAGGNQARAGSSAGMSASRAGAGGQVSEEDAGVADSGATQTPQPVACDFRGLMQAKCGSPSCHGAPGSSTGLDLTSAMLAARVAGRQGSGACSDKLLVDPENPRDSKLYLKVSGTTCGPQMPLGGQLNTDEQACVLTWMEQL